ncbi:MAG: glycosyltransferase family 4 protein [Thermoanaerobaculia bacterium]|nr:glycosyltransferase family 4 protein [Thermoanaerobaculia bacterium]
MDEAHGRRVLIVVQDLPVPYDRRTWLVATTLREAGYQVSVICPKAMGFDAAFENRRGIDIYRYPLPGNARSALGYAFEFGWCLAMAALLSLRIQLFGRGFDTLHACNPPETYWLLALAWRPFGKGFVFDHHDLSPEMYEAKFSRTGGLLHRWLHVLERRSFAMATTSIACNESYRRVACGRGGMDPSRVFVVRSAPDGLAFQPTSPDPSLRRGRRHLCLYLGRLCEQDGVDRLLQAARHVVVERGRDDVAFVVVGEGPALSALRSLAAELGIADDCVFTGFLPATEVSAYLSTADLGVDPGPKNPWSDCSTMNKVMDYMYFACPVVGFDLAENRYTAGAAGLFVSEESPAALGEAILELLDDPERRRTMGAEGSERVRLELMWEHSAPHLLAAYEHHFRSLGRTRPRWARATHRSS